MSESALAKYFQSNVKRFRELAMYSQVELSRACGRSDNWLSRIESGAIGISTDALEDLAKALRIEPAELIESSKAGETGEVRALRARIKTLEREKADAERLIARISDLTKNF